MEPSDAAEMQFPAVCVDPSGPIEQFWVSDITSETDATSLASVAVLTLGCPFTKDDVVRLRVDAELGLRAEDVVMRSPHITYRGALYAGGPALPRLTEDEIDEVFGAMRAATTELGCETQHNPFGPEFSADHDGYIVTYAIRPNADLARQLLASNQPEDDFRERITHKALGALRGLPAWPLLHARELVVALDVEAIWLPSDPVGPLDMLWM